MSISKIPIIPNINIKAIIVSLSSISKRTTLGTIEIGGIRSGQKTQSFEFGRTGDNRYYVGAG